MADRRQIDQMCRFILQEAQEKAQEIMIKTDHDCMRNKQLEVLKANKVTDAKFEERLLQLDADKKVLRSQAVARARRQKGECAHILVDQVEALALSKIKEQVQRQPEAYRTLLGKMITEALVQLDEEFVSIECVKGEEAIVNHS